MVLAGSERIGQQRSEFAHTLPQRPYPYPSDQALAVPHPPGTACAFYRSNSVEGLIEPPS